MVNKEEKDDDIEIDSSNLDDSVVVEETQGETIKKLREKLKQAETKAKEYLDGWQRSQADFVNLRKRDEEAKVEFIKFARLSLIEELIPVLDSFNIAMSGGNKDLPAGQGQAGIEPVYTQFWGILKADGLEEFNPMGEIFDPKYHETMGTIQTEKAEDDHKILEVAQKGYRLSGKIIRPAKVKIGEPSDKIKNNG
ncbi:MAG: nucleotide exchange factor GrpE [bacterium]|nr:nucleotide exchange factor GrpE [bacterium]